MKRADYNIEYAHIYVNENFTTEHFRAATITKNKIEELRSQKQNFTLAVLIDDYNPTDSILNIKAFLKELESMGVKPDYVVLESSLAKYKDKLLDEMSGKIEKSYDNYIDIHQKCPCSSLLAVWYLLRLGIFKDRQFKIKEKKSFYAEKLLTILPHRYGAIERKALDIIKATRYKDRVKDLEYVFF